MKTAPTLFLTLFSFLLCFSCGEMSSTNQTNGIAEDPTTVFPPIEPSKNVAKPERPSVDDSASQAMKAPDSPNLHKGYFVYAADAALFFPCGDQNQIAVAQNEAYLPLEKAYISLEDRKFGEKVYVTIEGKIRPKGEGEMNNLPTLIIEKLLSMERGKICDPQ